MELKVKESMKGENFYIKMGVALGGDYSSEQMALMDAVIDDYGVTNNLLNFACPGSGKTHAVVGGLCRLNTIDKVRASKTKAISFTVKSTKELEERLKKSCKTLGIDNKVTVCTMDGLCTRILKKHSAKLGIPDLTITKSRSPEKLVQFLSDVAEENSLELNLDSVKAIVNACKFLNSSLIFDKEHVVSSEHFKKTNCTYEEFMTYRQALYRVNKLKKMVTLDDILLYTLELISKYPEVAEEEKQDTELLIVDEFQDLSVLEIELLSKLCQKMIAVGDIDQQIYAFKGACSEVVAEYFKRFPDAKKIRFSKSYRCKQEIADYAANIIVPNDMTECYFEGTGYGGIVEEHENSNMIEAADKIEKDYKDNNNWLPYSIKVLYRNNDSVVPIVEELFKRGVPCRAPKYYEAYKMKVISDMCEVVELAKKPDKVANLDILKRFLPELKEYDSMAETPIYQIMTNTQESILEIKYKWKDEVLANEVFDMLEDVRALWKQRSPFIQLVDRIMPLYKQTYLDKVERYWDKPASYYINKITTLITNKSYEQFYRNEQSKMEWLAKNEKNKQGVQCLTMHTSKGLEADVIHILDCEDGILPNDKQLQRTIDMDCLIEAARAIRNERSLLFVACTRAKEELHIHYNVDKSSLLKKGYNKYIKLDAIYKQNKDSYDDMERFKEFCAKV